MIYKAHRKEELVSPRYSKVLSIGITFTLYLDLYLLKFCSKFMYQKCINIH